MQYDAYSWFRTVVRRKTPSIYSVIPNSPSLLITDDDRDVRETLGSIFKPRGFQTLLASDGKEALDIVQHEQVHLVLIDMLEQGEQTATITGFAAFYVIGCVDDDDGEATKTAIEADLTQIGTFLNRCESPTGQDDILGIFVQSLAPPMDVADPDANLPLAIVLVK